MKPVEVITSALLSLHKICRQSTTGTTKYKKLEYKVLSLLHPSALTQTDKLNTISNDRGIPILYLKWACACPRQGVDMPGGYIMAVISIMHLVDITKGLIPRPQIGSGNGTRERDCRTRSQIGTENWI